MNISCTDISQSKMLAERGLDVSTADAFITPKVGGYVVSTEKAANSVPSWSVVKLFGMIPTTIHFEGSSYNFRFYQEDGYFGCRYVSPDDRSLMYFSKWSDLIEILTEAVIWLLDGGFIKK